MNYELENLRAQVIALQAQIAALESRIPPQIDDPFREVFIATVDGTTFTEKAIVGGVVSDYTDGRTAEFLELESDQRVMLRVRDGDVFRYVEVGAGVSVKYGKATADWTSGNSVTLDPCDIAGVDTGEANITAKLFSPERGTFADIQIEANDVCTYLPQSDGTGLIVAVNFIPSPTGTSLGTTKYQVFQMTTNTTAGWDWVRAH